jgi:hypothetical protein
MGWWIFDRRSPRDKALAEIAERLDSVENVLSDDVEDQQLAGIMHRLGRIEHYISQEAAPEQTGPNSNMGDVAIGILSELIPSQFRGMAQGPIREFFKNPANVEIAKQKLLELGQVLNKGQPIQQPQLPTNQPAAPQQQQPLFYQSYRPPEKAG